MCAKSGRGMLVLILMSGGQPSVAVLEEVIESEDYWIGLTINWGGRLGSGSSVAYRWARASTFTFFEHGQ